MDGARTSGEAVNGARVGVSSPFVFATAQYESGDWDSAPSLPGNLIDSVARYTSLPVAPQRVAVPLASDDAVATLTVRAVNHDRLE